MHWVFSPSFTFRSVVFLLWHNQDHGTIFLAPGGKLHMRISSNILSKKEHNDIHTDKHEN